MKTIKQVEEFTGIKSDNLRQRIRRKTLKATKKGRDWLVSEVEMMKLVPDSVKELAKDIDTELKNRMDQD